MPPSTEPMPSRVRTLAAVVLPLGLAASLFAYRLALPPEAAVAADEPAYGAKKAGPIAIDFSDWPKDRKPDLVILLSGQTHGYLQPCGCSRPQLGGLERRYNLIE